MDQEIAQPLFQQELRPRVLACCQQEGFRCPFPFRDKTAGPDPVPGLDIPVIRVAVVNKGNGNFGTVLVAQDKLKDLHFEIPAGLQAAAFQQEGGGKGNILSQAAAIFCAEIGRECRQQLYVQPVCRGAHQLVVQ